MGLARNALIAASQSQWLREHAMRWRFVRRASRRFLPGERYEDALAAARDLEALGIGSMLSRVGENIAEAAEAEAVAEHYATVLAAMQSAGLPGSLSIKPTQLGLDLDAGLCRRNLERMLDASEMAPADKRGVIWIDMESSAYVDRTLELYRGARTRHSNVGVCLQSYLRRTPADIDSLLPLGPVIRLVKGAYHEPASIAFPAKRDVDEAFFALAQKLLSAESLSSGTRAAFATHDPKLIERVVQLVTSDSTSDSKKTRGQSAAGSRVEFQTLYGIRRDLQRQLAADGWPVSVLISYGTYWFPWYMRRLAERPANVWFVVKNIFG
ncbi:MAG TPA: proline dehydrogenase family protein [Candidatus Acidoferrales bacterium]|jgi:proline dehydrogenase|nr:proline dehydrogenase family protein [Candidatus Acidoferrales bacterium]